MITARAQHLLFLDFDESSTQNVSWLTAEQNKMRTKLSERRVIGVGH